MRKREWLAIIATRDETIEAMRLEAFTERVHCDQRKKEMERFYLDRIRELEDTSRATSLAQLRGMHPTAAMELMPPEPARKFFVHDATGLISTEVDPRDVELES